MQQVVPTEVVIAGAGPVGMSLAVELGLRGVTCVLVDGRTGRSVDAPRAKLTNVRSMETMRRWGIADRVRAAAPLPPGYSSDVVFLTSLTGRRLTAFSNAFYTDLGRVEEFAEPAQQIPQNVLESVLRDFLTELPAVSVLTGRVVAHDQTDAGVDVRVEQEGAGGTTSVTGRYLVGCDGGHSSVRKALGIPLEGRHAMTRNVGIVFSAPGLAAVHDQGRALHYWVVNPDAPGFMGPVDDAGTWWLIGTDLPLEQHDVDPGRMIAQAVGQEVDAEVLLVDPWEAHRLIARSMRSGRVFLAGDAAHLNPPFGAHGMNMGIGDAVDLGWKLAAVLQGWASPRLLDSYEAERRPMHEAVLDEATHNNSLLSNGFVTDHLESDGHQGDRARSAVAARIQATKEREFRSLGLILGHSYDGSPVIVSDGTAPVAQTVVGHVPSARPGSRLPHAWLPDGSSLFDHLGPGLTLLCATAADPLAHSFAASATRRGVPLVVVGADVVGLPDWERYGGTAVLVRPDQHVAWRQRSADGPGAPDDVLDLVLGTALEHDGGA